MKKTSYALLRRNLGRAGLCIAALGGLPLAHAADARFDGFMARVVGNNTTVGIGSGGQMLATSSAGLGTPGLGSMGVSTVGTGARVAGNVSIPLGNTGKTAAAVASAGISRAAFIRGLGALASGPAGALAIGIGGSALIDWLESGGKVRVDRATGAVQHLVGAGTSCAHVSSADYPPFSPYTGAGWTYVWMSKPYATYCEWGWMYTNPEYGFSVHGYWAGQVTASLSQSAGDWLPAKMADIAPYVDAPDAPALTPGAVIDLTKAGGDPFGGEAPVTTVTGPASVPGAKATTTTQTQVNPGTATEVPKGTTNAQPATKTTTTTDTHKVQYSGDKASYTTVTNTTTNITNNVTGDTITNVEETKTEDDSKTECEENPDSLNCADLDTPEVEIPKDTRTLTLKDENLFGSGSCPADKYATIGGQSLKVVDWQQDCAFIVNGVKPVLLILAAIAAFMIVSGGSRSAA